MALGMKGDMTDNTSVSGAAPSQGTRIHRPCGHAAHS
jgi:hypothetical protein